MILIKGYVKYKHHQFSVFSKMLIFRKMIVDQGELLFHYIILNACLLIFMLRAKQL